MFTKPNKIIALGGLLIAISIILGAFAAHALKNKFMATDQQLATFKTGVDYQLYHGFALILLGLINKVFAINVKYITIMFVMGVICFSWSLFGISITGIFKIDATILGPITPIGGGFFIVGWGLFISSIFKNKLTT